MIKMLGRGVTIEIRDGERKSVLSASKKLVLGREANGNGLDRRHRLQGEKPQKGAMTE